MNLNQSSFYLKALNKKLFKIVAEISEKKGLKSYVIGGYVRDFLLNKETPKDIDIVTDGSGIELAQFIAQELPTNPKVHVFKNFGTAMIRMDDYDIEFVGARKESYRNDSRNPEVTKGTLSDDQKRRDFTVNALAFSLNKEDYGNLIDPFNGLRDLEKGILRTPLDPDLTYTDDPLRMLRAIRFACQLGFKIEDTSLEAISRNTHRIDILSKERINDEFNKIMYSEKPSRGFLLLDQCGLLELILPEVTNLKGVDEIDGQSHKDNFHHTLEVLDNVSHHSKNLWLRWAALLHDIGKGPTKKFDKKIGWTFHLHEFIGSKMAHKIFKRMKLPITHLKYVQNLIMMSARPITLANENTTDSAVRRLIYDAGDDLEDLLILCESDITTKNATKKRQYLDNYRVIRTKIEEVESRDQIRNFKLPISGEEIMHTFNIKPSREIGLIKAAIKEAILEGDIENSKQAAIQYMFKIAEQLNITVKDKNSG